MVSLILTCVRWYSNWNVKKTTYAVIGDCCPVQSNKRTVFKRQKIWGIWNGVAICLKRPWGKSKLISFHRVLYDKMIIPLQNLLKNGPESHHTFEVGHKLYEQSLEKIASVYYNINRFLSAFIDHVSLNDKGLSLQFFKTFLNAIRDWRILNISFKRSRLSRKCLSLSSPTMDRTVSCTIIWWKQNLKKDSWNLARGVFYLDSGHSFDNVLFYGNDTALFLHELILFIWIFVLSDSYIAGILAVAGIQQVRTDETKWLTNFSLENQISPPGTSVRNSFWCQMESFKENIDRSSISALKCNCSVSHYNHKKF